MAVGRDEARIDDPLDVALGDEGRRGQHVERDQRGQADDRHRVAEPARPVRREDRTASAARVDGHRHDRHGHVQPQLRPAVRVLVEPQAQRRTGQHDDGQADQRDGQRRRTPRGRADDGISRADEEAAGQAGGRDELEVAAPGVVGCRSCRRRPACPARRTGRRPGGRRRAPTTRSTPTSTTSASVVPRSRRSAGDRRRAAAAPSEARSTVRDARRRHAQQAADEPGDGEDEEHPPGRSPRSMRSPRTSSKPRRKIGSADANRTAKMSTSGMARTRPRPTGAEPGRSAARPVARAAVGRAASAPGRADDHALEHPGRHRPARPTPSAGSRPGPENAAIEAPVQTAAPSRSRMATNGSARMATKPARTRAATGSQASSGSGARPAPAHEPARPPGSPRRGAGR